MTQLADFLFPAPAGRSVGSILSWWERRRLAYNAAVGSAGLVSLGVWVGGSAAFGDELEPALLVAVVAFAVMANMCYLLGPATEVLVWKLWGRRVLPVGPTLYRMGLTFSVGLALFPTLIALILMTVRLLVVIVLP